jgi:HD superfamily phosphohydrolase
MIRERYDIDNELILHFLDNNKFNYSIQKNLLDWYALLGEKDFKQNRDKAIEFIKGIAEDVFGEVEFSKADKDKLIGVFEPLETILRTAQSLNTAKKINLRDHLSHTIRVLLFSNYLFSEYYKIKEDENRLKKEVFIAAIFHDLAYPIEKIKAIGNNLSEGTFKELLNSSGKIEFSLDNPKDLLDLMDFWGTLPNILDKEYENDLSEKGSLSKEEKNEIQKEKDRNKNKIKHIYKEIIAPAIAGQGLFNTKHNLSSVVLFLRPILKDWRDSKTYLRKKIETICDICLAIAYHDRSLPISNFSKDEYKSEIPLAVKILRIADELQEWDRTRKDESYTANATFGKSSEFFSINFQQKDVEIVKRGNTEIKECNPCSFIPDKIEGLLPLINNNSLLLKFNLPNPKKIGDFKIKEKDERGEYIEKSLEDVLRKKYKTSIENGNKSSSKVEVISLLFKGKEVVLTYSLNNKTCATIKCELQKAPKGKKLKDESPPKGNDSPFIKELTKFRQELCVALEIKTIPETIENAIKDDLSKVFETRPLLTLNGREQLGLLRCVKKEWSEVKHTRYQHSIGVAAKCIVVCDYLNSKMTDVNLKFTIQDVKELALAAALHDCGHLPVSHAVERAFLSSKFEKTDVTHEARIIPLLLRPNPFFEDLQNLTKGWAKQNKDFDDGSLYRVAAIISPEKAKTYIKGRSDLYPKRAISQLLSSDIDLDRLDYIIRDSEALQYEPVKLLNGEILRFIGNLIVAKAKTLHKGFENDIELCVNIEKEKDLQYLFYLLVSRVLLYKYCYFSPKVRSFEAILTYLISDFLERDIAIEPLKLIAMSDKQFIGSDLDNTKGYIEKLLEFIPEEKDRVHFQNKYVNVLKKDKTERFKYWYFIDTTEIKNPRLAKELEKNLNKHSYIDIVKKTIIEESEKEYSNSPKKEIIEKEDLLFDVFALKTGGGDLLVSEKGKLKTLSKYMNGSNMHRLCTETRLDIYHKSDIGDRKKEYIKNLIDRYYGEAE